MRILFTRTLASSRRVADILGWISQSDPESSYRTVTGELAKIVTSYGGMMARPAGTILMLGHRWVEHPQGRDIERLAKKYNLPIEYLED